MHSEEKRESDGGKKRNGAKKKSGGSPQTVEKRMIMNEKWETYGFHTKRADLSDVFRKGVSGAKKGRETEIDRGA